MEVSVLATGLRELEPGYWVAADQDSVSYPEHGHSSCYEVEASSYWFRHRNLCVASIVARFPPNGPIVDIGGGNGFVTLGLERAGFETMLVEPGEVGARNGFTRGLRPVVQATFEDAGFLPQSLPAVGVFDVVEHIENDAAFLDRIRAALQPGGRLYVTVPAFQWLWSPEDVDAGHFRRYTRSSLVGLLRATGFQVEYTTFLFWLLPLPIFLLRSVAGRVKVRKTGSQELSNREHQTPGGAQGALLEWLLAQEAARLDQGKSMPFGSSILAVARKGRADRPSFPS